jgi:hypothetical protein
VKKEFVMTRIHSLLYAAVAPIALLGMVAGISLNAGPANAVVYCKYIGVPQGCVARRGVVLVPAPVVVRDRGAPGVGVRRGTPANRGGPVNRVGRR